MHRISLLAAALVPALAFSAEPIAWNFDKGHSEIGFTARHLGFAKIRGRFNTFTVTSVKADPATGKLTALEAEADAASIDTGVERRDNHLRSDDFFNAEKHPKLKLKLKSIQWKGDAFDAIATLTIRDNTRDVPLTGELLGFETVNFGRGPQLRAAYEATGKINRKEFGLKFSGLAEGTAVVADEVVLDLQASFWVPVPEGQTQKASGRK